MKFVILQMFSMIFDVVYFSLVKKLTFNDVYFRWYCLACHVILWLSQG